MPKHLKKRTRNWLIAIAVRLESIATRIRGYVNARTPRRGPRKTKASGTRESAA
jgi:hypothetical protein